ncbi:hypothetical protein EEL50_11675 [Muribaculaceae bacterium Isolate-105 (HZI)]|nr:hypothetical protein EEL50_11675 [Muribaculaceae bacterium Isolate-105 (HZI)]
MRFKNFSWEELLLDDFADKYFLGILSAHQYLLFITVPGCIGFFIWKGVEALPDSHTTMELVGMIGIELFKGLGLALIGIPIGLFCLASFLWMVYGLTIIFIAISCKTLTFCMKSFFHPKNAKGCIVNYFKSNSSMFLGISVFMVILFLSGAIPMKTARICATLFAKPSTENWDDAYYARSRYAKSYHYSRDCKYLQQTTHEIKYTSVDNAEFYYELQPCKHCLQESVKYQYDRYGALCVIPVFFLLIWLTSRIYNYLELRRSR